MARRHRAPLVNVVHDVHPELAVRAGVSLPPLGLAAAEAWVRQVYRGAAATVVLGPGMADLVVEHFREEEDDSVTPRGTPKHWHIYHIVARKP